MSPPMSSTPAAVERLTDMAEFFEEAIDAFIAESVCKEHAADLRWSIAELSRLEEENATLRGIRPLQGDDLVATVKAHRERYGSNLKEAVDAVRAGWTTNTEWQDAFVRATCAEAENAKLRAERDEALERKRLPCCEHMAERMRQEQEAAEALAKLRARGMKLSPTQSAKADRAASLTNKGGVDV